MLDSSWVESVDAKNFSNKSVMLLSRFARTLKQVNGSVLVLKDSKVLKNALVELRVTGDERLQSIFDELTAEIQGVRG